MVTLEWTCEPSFLFLILQKYQMLNLNLEWHFQSKLDECWSREGKKTKIRGCYCVRCPALSNSPMNHLVEWPSLPPNKTPFPSLTQITGFWQTATADEFPARVKEMWDKFGNVTLCPLFQNQKLSCSLLFLSLALEIIDKLFSLKLHKMIKAIDRRLRKSVMHIIIRDCAGATT